jgi:hypothetical protein
VAAVQDLLLPADFLLPADLLLPADFLLPFSQLLLLATCSVSLRPLLLLDQ